MKKPLYTFLLLFYFSCAAAQPPSPEYGQITREEIDMKTCSFDTEAEAVVLLDDAWTDYNDSYNMITRRRIRIKIFSEKGLEKANVVIPFYSGDEFEFIRNVQGITFTIAADGSYTHTELDRKSVFIEKKDNYYSLVKFAMPAVKAGSIIEYRYESVMKHYGGLENWAFQTDVPTVKSSYMLQIIPDAEFTYNVQKRKDYRITIKPIQDQGRIYFEMNHIPGLRFEPYMDAPRDYIQRVDFQLSGIINRYGDKQNINTTWKSTAYDLMTEKAFGSQLNKDLNAVEVKQLVRAQTSDIARMKAIYDYVRTHIAWNGYVGKYTSDGLKKVLDSKRGHAGEINLLLVNLLITHGIKAYPLLVAERDFGKIDSTYPFLDLFNKVAAYVMADGKEFILDASQKNVPAGLTPYSLLNTLAFKVDKKEFALLRIGSGSRSYKNVITIQGALSKNGHLTGQAFISGYDYAREQHIGAIYSDQKTFITENYEKPHEDMTIDSFSFSNLDNDSLPLEINIHFNQKLNASGGFVFAGYNLFMGMTKSPFTSSVRFTNVNFGFPAEILLEATIQLPADVHPDELPKPQVLEDKSKTIRLSRDLILENGQLKVQVSYRRITTLVPAASYTELKEFYKKMVDMLNEPVVIKLPG